MTAALTPGQGWEQEMWYRLALGIAESSRVRRIVDQLFARARSVLRTDYEFVMLANARGSALKGLAAHGVHADRLRQEHIHTAEELPPVLTAFHTRQPVVIGDFAHDPSISPRLRRQYPAMHRTWMLPLVHGHRVIGVLGVGYTAPREISPQQFRVLQQLKAEATQALAPALLTQVLLEHYAPLVPLAGEASAAFSPFALSPSSSQARAGEEGWPPAPTSVEWECQAKNVVAVDLKGVPGRPAADPLSHGAKTQYASIAPAALQEQLRSGGVPVGQTFTSPCECHTQPQEPQWREFLSTFAHDIRNPLGVILGYAEMLIEQAQEKGTVAETGLLERIKSNALMVHALVSNYLDLTRIEAKWLTVTKQPLALNELLQRVGQLYEAEARRRRVTVEWQLHPALPLIAGDPLALERVFANLLHNALKFTPATGRVTISTTYRGSQVMVAVTDTGPGIAPEELPLLFQKYRRARFSLTQEGTGLGLFIVKSLVEAHGGYVTVQSVPGQGTCFRVVLTASPSPLPAD